MRLIKLLNGSLIKILIKDNMRSEDIRKRAEWCFIAGAVFVCPALLLERFIPFWIDVIFQILWLSTFIAGCVLFSEYKKRVK